MSSHEGEGPFYEIECNLKILRAIIRGINSQYLGSWVTSQKSNDTLLSQTLKVEEKKVTKIFYI